MEKSLFFQVTFVFLLAVCGVQLAVTTDALHTVDKNTATPTISPTLTSITKTWHENPLIENTFPITLTNPTINYQKKDIYGSGIVLNSDTRWRIDVQIDKLTQDVGEASTGIVLTGYSANKAPQHFVLVYQWGKWSIGYQPDLTGSKFTYWRTMESLVEPTQNFVLTISHDGKNITLVNDQGFTFQDVLPYRIFNDVYVVSTVVQIGPQTKMILSTLSIEQFQNEVASSPTLPSYFLTPTAMVLGKEKTEYVFYVSVSGSDSNPGTSDMPFATIEHARDVIRTVNKSMQGNIIVYIGGGVYSIKRPIQFSQQDSGQNGYDIIYRAVNDSSPALSGGVEVTGWHQLPNSQIWKTVLKDEDKFRQLYVNGIRAQRATSQDPIKGLSWKAGSDSQRNGIVVPQENFPNLSRPHDLELHWIYDWKDMRLLVDSVEKNPDGTYTIWMKQPYFSNALGMGNKRHKWYPKYNIPFYLENALELVDEPGEWYYNPSSKELFYLPRDGENMNNVNIVIPQTQTLLEITGGRIGQEVHNIAFEGLSFNYAGWTRASEVGTFGWQAQDLIKTPGWGEYSQEMTPAHVQLNSAHDITFERCRFEHLGAVGIELINNVYRVTVKGNLFHDISDGAIVVGEWNTAYITSPLIQFASHDIILADNLINEVGVEYWGAPAITAYFVNNIHVVHNEISKMPYTGISIGWGWSSTTDSTTSHDNYIAYNLITDLLERARDGGGIYTLGQQPETVIEGNVVQNLKGDYACLYPDEGSAYLVFRDNICDTAPEWLHLWTKTIHDNFIRNIYTNVTIFENSGTNNQIDNIVYVYGHVWPPEAQTIIDHAGLESEYSYLHGWLNGE